MEVWLNVTRGQGSLWGNDLVDRTGVMLARLVGKPESSARFVPLRNKLPPSCALSGSFSSFQTFFMNATNESRNGACGKDSSTTTQDGGSRGNRFRWPDYGHKESGKILWFNNKHAGVDAQVPVLVGTNSAGIDKFLLYYVSCGEGRSDARWPEPCGWCKMRFLSDTYVPVLPLY